MSEAVITKYKVHVHPNQLRKGDRFEEAVARSKNILRVVEIDSVAHGEIWHGRHLVPVVFVTGHDILSQGTVKYIRTPLEFIEVERDALPRTAMQQHTQN